MFDYYKVLGKTGSIKSIKRDRDELIEQDHCAPK